MNTSRQVRRRLVASAAGLAAAAGLAFAPSPASAEMHTINEPWSFSDSGEFEACGITVHSDFEIWGTLSIRTGKGKDASAFFAREQSASLETLTVAETGELIGTIETRQQIHDVKATRVEGSIFEFTTTQVGQPFTVRGADGTLLLRDRGLIAYSYLFDTGGDDEPGGVDVEDLGIRVAGPHPGLDADLCEVFSDAG